MKDWLKNLKFNESRIGFGLGVGVLVLAGMLLANYFRSINRLPAQERVSSTATEVTPTLEPGSSQETIAKEAPAPIAGTDYEIQKGDSLWNISMKTYGTGYTWSKIYDANKDTLGKNPSLINQGTKITLPAQESAPVTHTVVSGDNLWNISVKICNDGFQWSRLALDNNLAQPRLIFPGTVLNVRCK